MATGVAVDLKVDREIVKSAIQLNYQMSQLKADTEQLNSSGLMFSYGYDFTKNLTFQTQFLLSLQQSGSSTMTGFGVFGIYNFFRSQNVKQTLVKIDNKRLLTIENHLGSHLEAGLGAQQFYFNGTRGVYSVSGPSARFAFNFSLFGINSLVGVQSSFVRLSEKPTQLTTVLIGLRIPL